jgi:hypothetical protein
MAWYGPQGDCGCCQCYCEDDPSVVAPVLTGNLAIRTTISGLPSSFQYTSITQGFAGVGAFYARYVVAGLDQINGTYFSTLSKSGCGFLAEELAEGFTLTVDRYRRGHTGAFVFCDFDAEIFESTYSPNFELLMNWQGGLGGVSRLALTTSPAVPPFALWAFPDLFAKTILRCSKNYDMYEAEDTEIFKSRDYAVNSGQVWIQATTVMDCGNSDPDLSAGYVIGTIESEIVVV